VRKRGARGTGIELNPHLVKIALEEAQSQGVAERAKFLQGNLFNFELGGASVLTMYLFPQINVRLRPRLFEQLKPGTRVVSHDFHMDDWKPDAQREVPVPGKSYGAPRSAIYMWVMPENAAGNWNWQLPLNNVPLRFEATLTQRFQMLEISARAAGEKVAASEVQLRGDELRFRLTLAQSGPPVTYDFSGRISGDAAAGTVSAGAGAAQEWKATRTERGKIRLD
jgi:hypothetical protein